MRNYYFSALMNAFFIDNGDTDDENRPDDAVILSEEEVETYYGQFPPDGKTLGSVEGRPAWVDLPAEKVYFSASEVGYFIGSWRDNGMYTEENWPDDAVLMTPEEMEEYYGKGSPPGMMLGSKDGRPAWVELPHEMQVNIAAFKKQSLMDAANQKISVWQTKLLMGRKLTETEMGQLNLWMDYIDVLDAIDPSDAPEIEWPVEPQPQ